MLTKGKVILCVSLACIAAMVFSLIPKGLTSYFRISESPDYGSIAILFPAEERRQSDLYDKSEIERLWAAIQKTKVHYSGRSDTFSCDQLITVYLVNRETRDHISFYYTDSGHLILNDREYQITSGEAELGQAIRSAAANGEREDRWEEPS